MHIELQKWSEEKKADLIKICNEADRSWLSNRMPFPYTEENADWWVKMVSEQDGKEGVFRAVVVDGKVVGNITAEREDDVCCKDCILGYLLLSEYWSKGIMTEAVHQFCKIVFEELDVVRITGRVFAPNAGSRKVLERNGFALEGIQKKAAFKIGEIYDVFLYVKLKTDD